MVETGAVVSAGSDWSVSSLAPLDGIQVGVTHRDPEDPHRTSWRPEERVDLPTAIAMYTINAANHNHLERQAGSIKVGKLADLVVLERNLFEVPVDELHAVRVMKTIVEGKTVFQQP